MGPKWIPERIPGSKIDHSRLTRSQSEQVLFPSRKTYVLCFCSIRCDLHLFRISPLITCLLSLPIITSCLVLHAIKRLGQVRKHLESTLRANAPSISFRKIQKASLVFEFPKTELRTMENFIFLKHPTRLSSTIF